jgi:hypothetical protein
VSLIIKIDYQNKNCEKECQYNKFKLCKIIFDDNNMKSEEKFIDVWTNLKKSNGFTFTNYKNLDMCRPDRILFRNFNFSHSLSPNHVYMLGKKPILIFNNKPVYISDHRFLISDFDF